MVIVKRLVWEKINIDHISRHDVTPQEVEQVCRRRTYITLEAHHGRLMIIGPTDTNRILAIILDPEPTANTYYPVTARTADRQERRKYQQKIEKE